MSKNREFLKSFRTRSTFATAARAGIWCLAGAILAVLVYALWWRSQGHAVPWGAYPVIIFWALVVALLWTLAHFPSLREAARQADDHYKLKDAMSSALHFETEGREGGVYELQRRALESKLGEARPSDLPLRAPLRVLAGAGGGLVVAILLAFLPNSDAVQRQLDAEQVMLDRSSEVKEQLDEVIEEMLADLDDEEKELLNPEELREWVKELKETKDQKEALRQLARFEQKLAKAMQGLEARKDEETLKLAAAELDKSDLASARQVGKKLDLKEFEQAALDLKNLKDGDRDAKGRKLTNEEKKKMLKNLREATKRMANGAKQQKNRNQNLQPGKMGEMQPLDEMLEDLDEAAEDMEEELEEMEMGEGECECEGDLDGELGKLMKRMKGLDARKKLRGKLKKMRENLGQCQSFAGGGVQQLGLAKGGLKPGKGSVESRREGETEMPEQMAVEQLKGQKGQGPSQSSVEDAESGTGVSGKTGVAQKRDFSRQMESFVQRDDVPEEMKIGVREYFERVHEVETEEE